ncbi:hypothetical protein SOVF_198210, partial [Spinacia oleracea]
VIAEPARDDDVQVANSTKIFFSFLFPAA